MLPEWNGTCRDGATRSAFDSVLVNSGRKPTLDDVLLVWKVIGCEQQLRQAQALVALARAGMLDPDRITDLILDA